MMGAQALYAFGKSSRIVPIGLMPEVDLINGLQKVCTDNDIRYGVILAVIGSLHKLTIAQVVTDEMKAKFGKRFMEERVIPGPIQVLGAQGIIYEQESGEIEVHLHGSFNDTNKQVHGGHLVAGGNPVRSRLEVVIAEIKDVRLVERYNEETGVCVFSPEQL